MFTQTQPNLNNSPQEILSMIAERLIANTAPDDKLLACQNFAGTSKFFRDAARNNHNIKLDLLQNKREVLVARVVNLSTASRFLARTRYPHGPDKICESIFKMIIGYGGSALGGTGLWLLNTFVPAIPETAGYAMISDFGISVMTLISFLYGVKNTGSLVNELYKTHRYERPPGITASEMPNNIARDWINSFPSCRQAQEAIDRLATLRQDLQNTPIEDITSFAAKVKAFAGCLEQLAHHSSNTAAPPTEITPLLADEEAQSGLTASIV